MDKTEIFIQKAISKHGDTFDYSLVSYVKSNIKVKIICNEHGEFLQTPNQHLSGHGCSKCGSSKVNQKNVLGTAEFIKRANAISKHEGVYDYSLVDYIKNNIKVNIICKQHGVFKQTPNNHLSGNGCPTCGKIARGLKSRNTKSEFITKAKSVHNSKYNYDMVDYVNNRTKINIICPTHNVFAQSPDNHLAGKGCPYCADNSNLTKRFEYYKSTPTQFYVIKYKGLYKVGITTKTVDKRYAQEVSDTDEIETLFIKYFDNYKDAYTHEQCMLLLNTNYKYTGEPIFNNTGTSEVFTSLHKESFN